MKAKTKFLKMFYKLPDKAKKELVYQYWSTTPMSMNVCALEVRMNTDLGKKILYELGFEDDE